ncbi:ABC transporter permease [Chondrinema litorale]|uniref:ABC transporter permease n=1 Tax=Chondrinema litorale TaxID=2994555 RepID=UPI002543E365|nr:ABC transporter permease [Chondrinema litorale]UZR96336.1 ABC transporter permease [Chondrinema litorale]
MNAQPPKQALKFLRWFCREDFLDEIEGDLIEIFEMHYEQNPKHAIRSFWWQVLLHFRPDYIKSFNFIQFLIYQNMLHINFKIAWRHITKKKLYSIINITGLGVGIASCLLILLYIQFELSYDQYHTKLNDIYRVLHAYKPIEKKNMETQPEEFQVWGNAPIAEAMSRDFPEVESIFQFTSPANFLFQYKEKIFQEDNMIFADSNAFQMFSWKMLQGDPLTALDEPYNIVLTEDIANKYFGNEDPLGKTIIVDENDTYTVSGVMENVPDNSHFTFDGLVSMSTFRKYRPGIFANWGYVDFYTYFTLYDKSQLSNIEAKADEFTQKYTGNWDQTHYVIAFEPMTDAYLHSKAGRQPGDTGSLSNLYIFASIALFILLIACINFINLSTSRSLERAKEVGIRKVAGAVKTTLTVQFLTEYILLTFLSLLLALILVVAFAPILQDLIGKPINYQILFSWQILPILLVATILIGLLAGSYPAWLLSKFSPATVLKGIFRNSNKGIALRKVLVVFQFSLSIALMIGTSIVLSQLEFLQNKDLGFDKEQMLILDFGWDNKVQQQIEAIEQSFLAHPNVTAVSASRAVPGDFLPNAGTTIENAQGEMMMYSPTIYEIDQTFIQNYNIEMAAGRPFSIDFPSDSVSSLILNETAATLWGYEDPKEMIGKPFDQWGKKGIVVGVVKDFNYQSLHREVEPLSLRFEPYSLRKFSIRVKPQEIRKTLADLEETWKELIPHRPFVYTFLDDSFNKQYQADNRFSKIFGIFTSIAIFIACLGLFGLTAYTTSQRTKEIGIRKVLGASVLQIITLLSTGFIKLFLISLIIAIPAAWYFMAKWLDTFAYQIGMNVFIFALAGFLALTIALITISWQSLKAAIANPIDSLRSE